MTFCTAACGSDSESPSPWDVIENDEDAPRTTRCEGEAPTCDDGCGGTTVAGCVDGTWECPSFENAGPCRTPTEDPLPDEDECAGTPMCSAICGDAWGECIGGEWVCQYSDESNTCDDTPPDVEACATSSSSTLPGVTIELSGNRCHWTAEEVALGVEIPYTITIEEAITVSPDPGASGCTAPGDSRLYPFELIEGNDQKYCLCDQGLCDTTRSEIELVPGEYHGAIEWDGRNWTGPSDTGNPKGGPFPPGIYEASVTATGTASDGSEYQVAGTLDFMLQ